MYVPSFQKAVVRSLLAGGLSAVLPAGAQAPATEIIVPWPAAGETDLLGRPIVPYLFSVKRSGKNSVDPAGRAFHEAS